MKAFVDSREPKDVKNMFHTQFSGTEFETETKELPQADFYLPEYDVAVERKEASDFASSTTEGRLSEQADRMAAEHDYNFLILEGSPYSLQFTDVNSHSLTSMQTSLAVKRGIMVIYTDGFDETVYAVNRIFERFADGEHKEADGGYVKTADTGEVDDVQVAMLMQIDGISEEKARDILDRVPFTDLGYLTPLDPNDTELELTKVDGIGPTLAERVINAFQ